MQAGQSLLNRAARRQQDRQQRRAQPSRRPREISADPVRHAILHATRLTAAEREKAIRPARVAFKALREGVASFEQWAQVASLVAIALAIEDQGVMRGIRAHLQAAESAIDAIFKRVEAEPAGAAWGRRTTLYFQEIDVLQEAIALHDAQLQVLSASELHAAVRTAERKVLAAGGQVIHQPDPGAQPVQEQLL